MSENIIKKATWLDLLFDLIFVFAIAKATHILAHAHDGHLSINQYVIFVLVIIPIWWTWTGHTLFATRFDTNDTTQKVLTLAQMLAVVFWSAFIHPDFDPNYLGYLLFYVIIRILLMLMYWRATRVNPLASPIAKRLCTGFSVGLVVALSSLLFEPPIRYFVLYAGITIEIITPLVSRDILRTVPVSNHHLPERYGLLTIILLGESVIMISSTLSEIQWIDFTVGAAISGFLIMASFWWLYFDLMEKTLPGEKMDTGQHFIYGHLFIYMGLSICAVFIGFTINPELSFNDHLALITIGFASLLFGLVLSFSINALIKRKFLFIYFLFLGAISMSIIINSIASANLQR